MSPLRAFIAGGQTGVSLFFVLSAFCLTLPFFMGPAPSQEFALRDFYSRRALRILPLYWSYLLLAAAVHARGSADLTNLIPYAFFLNSFEGMAVDLPPFTNVVWSLATEAQFYLVLPLLPCALRSRTVRLWAMAALVLYGAWYVAFLCGFFTASSVRKEIYLCASLLGRGPIFLVGIEVAWIYGRYGQEIAKRLQSRPAFRSGAGDLLLLGILAALGYLLSLQVAAGFWTFETRPMVAWHVAEGLLWGSVLLALLVLPMKTKSLFCNPLPGRVGVLSYSIYLIHLPVLVYSFRWLRSTFPDPYRFWSSESATALIPILGVILALSSLSYRWIESPFLRAKARVGS